ncbi:MAG: cytochrome c biogenesis CcdA family protein [Candidatus Nanopelagicaceae bacterium]|nr:cytochrome c biogenesis CcdA family protein [Candidatus Nanopelagicaceae bacterium]
MIDVGYVAAFLGGVLALISPCSALLLPSFFAYSFQRPGRLLWRTSLFYLGLATTLVPLGVGSSFASRLFYGHREILISVAGWTIIGLGVVQFAGGGFAFKPAQRAQSRIQVQSNTSVFALGAVYGLAGFCSGPILGSVLMVAATSGQPIRGGALLAVYALGMSAPLFLLALIWDRFNLGTNRWLRGREIRLGRVHLHSTSLISGLLFIGIGVLFLRYDGTAGITGVLGGSGLPEVDYKAQQWIQTIGSTFDFVVLLVIGIGAVGLLAYRMSGRKERGN